MFDQKRLLTLAGITDDGSSNLLNEGVEPEEGCNEAEDGSLEQKTGGELDETADAEDADAPKSAEQLDEIRVRNFIRNEIRSMLNKMEPNDRRNWILRGQQASVNSRPGQVSRGFTGPGFVR